MRTTDPSSPERYVEALYAREDDGLKAIRDRLVDAGRWGVNIGANEGKILQILVRLSGARKIVEIGTLFGYSTVWLARALPEGGQIFSIERDHDCVRMARKAFADCGVNERVTLLEGEASEKLQELELQAPFDFVFIDANKSAYCEYLAWAMKAVRVGGLIVADNTMLSGGVAADGKSAAKPDHLSMRQWSEMRRFNEIVAGSELFGTILPTAEGLTVAIRER